MPLLVMRIASLTNQQPKKGTFVMSKIARFVNNSGLIRTEAVIENILLRIPTLVDDLFEMYGHFPCEDDGDFFSPTLELMYLILGDPELILDRDYDLSRCLESSWCSCLDCDDDIRRITQLRN